MTLSGSTGPRSARNKANADDWLTEKTTRKKAPTYTTLDNEVELLKRVLNYAVEGKKVQANPLASVKLLRKPNVRRSVLDEEAFQRLFDACEEALQPIVLMAFDTGMRKREVVMRMSGHKTRAVFDRYNIVSEDDLRDAVRRLDGHQSKKVGHVLDTVSETLPENQKPHRLNTGEA